MGNIKNIHVIEDRPLCMAASEKAEDVYGESYKKVVFPKEEADKALAYMKNRSRMSDADECRFLIFGFDDVDFSVVTNRKGESLIKHKGIIKEQK